MKKFSEILTKIYGILMTVSFFGGIVPLIPYVIAVSVAWLLQFAMTIPYAVKERYVYKPRLDLKSGYLGSFTKMVIVTIVTTSAYLFCYLIDASHAEQIGPGNAGLRLLGHTKPPVQIVHIFELMISQIRQEVNGFRRFRG